MQEVPVTFQSQGQQILGIWHSPPIEAGNRLPVVVFCHGFTGNKAGGQRIFVETARGLAARGIHSLRFDFRGSGDSAGAFVETTVSRQIEDAIAAVAHARSQPRVDAQRVILLGTSLGGLVSVLTLPSLPDLAAIVLWNPVSNPVVIASCRATPESDAQLTRWGFADYHGWPVGPAFLEELPQLRPMDAVVEQAAPMLILLGDADETVPNSDGLALAEARRKAGLPVEVETISGAGHTFTPFLARQEAIRTTIEWIAER